MSGGGAQKDLEEAEKDRSEKHSEVTHHTQSNFKSLPSFSSTSSV
jgi:hypothetical protein